MFTDMVGYSALTQRDEAAALELLERHRQLVRPILAEHGGREIKTIGDAFLVEFASALAAARGAIAIQRSLHAYNQAVPADRQVWLRIGLHAGDVVYRENDVFGDGVNIAARIEPLAEPGGICVSEDVARQIQNKLEEPVVRLGVGDLKNIGMSVAIFRIVLPWHKPRHRLVDRLRFSLRQKTTRRVALTALLALAAAGYVVVRQRGAAGPVNRLAVLPLVSIGQGAHDEFFADGLTEELISSLSTIRELNVIARTSVAKLKGTRLDIAEIGRALNVGSILEGSVRVAGDEARIHVHLVDVRTQKNIWSREFARTFKDVFAIQTAIAMSVTDALKIRLQSGERSLLERQTTDSSSAFREYLVGRSRLNRRTGEEVLKAMESFQRAVGQDAGFALAYAGLAEAYTLAGNAGYGDLPRDQAIEQARNFAHKALALDESLAEAHSALAYVKFRIDWDWAGTTTGFQRALELKPGNAKAHELYGLFLAVQRRFDEARAEMNRARELDPLSPSVSNGLGRLLHFERKYDGALAQFRRTLELEPGYAESYFSLAITHLCLRRYDEAVDEIHTAIRLSARRPIMLAMLGLALGRSGRAAETRKIFEEIQAAATPAAPNSYYLALLSLGMDEHDRAFDYLERALVERDGILIYLPIDPVTDSLWQHPRFRALVQKMNLPLPP